MKNYKQDIAQAMSEQMQQLVPGAAMVAWNELDKGLYCDFDMDQTVEPVLFDQLAQQMKAQALKGCFRLESFSGVYAEGNAQQPMLQRIVIAAFEHPQQMKAYDAAVAEAKARDHRKLGPQLDIYSQSEAIGQGLTLWHPHGAALRCAIERFSQDAQMLNDYQWVISPHIGRGLLWAQSGHLQFYQDAMYPPIDMEGEDYYLKPMSCPFHVHIYNQSVHSYRDLPVRLAEFGTVYRNELSGALSGLTRVRGFTQDDAHIICTPQQAPQELKEALKLSLYVLEAFGLVDYEIFVSTRPDVKCIGDAADWEQATDALVHAVESLDLPYDWDVGGGAFYGPKIDIKLRDALGRTWQCSTIQFDFNLPQRFNMAYINADGEKKTPYMVHRALFGSLERFVALLIEHYKGDFPLWMAPVQVGIVPIRERHVDYAQQVRRQLKQWGYRVHLNDRDVHMRGKIKQYAQEKVPVVLVIGDRDVDAQQVSVRRRGPGDLGSMTMDQLHDRLQQEIVVGIPRYIREDA